MPFTKASNSSRVTITLHSDVAVAFGLAADAGHGPLAVITGYDFGSVAVEGRLAFSLAAVFASGSDCAIANTEQMATAKTIGHKRGTPIHLGDIGVLMRSSKLKPKNDLTAVGVNFARVGRLRSFEF